MEKSVENSVENVEKSFADRLFGVKVLKKALFGCGKIGARSGKIRSLHYIIKEKFIFFTKRGCKTKKSVIY